MSELENASGQHLEALTLPELSDDAALEVALAELAPTYLDELKAAVAADFSGSRKDFSDFDTTEEYLEWSNANPLQQTLVERKYHTLLGIRSTNNFYVWFTSSTMGNVYNFSHPTTRAQKPAATLLNQLQTDEPDFFAACERVAKEQAAILGQQQNSGGRSAEEQRQLTIRQVTCKWKTALYMTAAFNKLLQYPSATEEQLTQLCI